MVTTECTSDLTGALRLVAELANSRGTHPGIDAAVQAAATAFNAEPTAVWDALIAGSVSAAWDAAAADPTTPAPYLEQIVANAALIPGAQMTCVSAAANPALTTAGRLALAAHEYDTVRCAVAEAGLTDLEVLQLLAGDIDPDIREAVAEHTNADAALRTHLAADFDEDVRAACAGFADELPPEITYTLAHDFSWRVRARVAKSSSSLELLELLAADTEHDVREEVAANPATDRSVLLGLAGDPCADVSQAARRQL